MKIIHKLLRFIIYWENRNTFCLFEFPYIDTRSLDPIIKKGIKAVPVGGLEGNKIQFIRLGRKEVKFIKDTTYRYKITSIKDEGETTYEKDK